MFSIRANGRSIHQPMDKRYVLLSPRVAVERGKSGSLTFRVPPGHPEYNSFQQLKTKITVSMDDEEIFRGRVLSNNRDMNNIRTVYCEGELAYLVDTVQKAEKYEGKVHDLFQKIIGSHNQRVESEKQFVIGEITVENRDVLIAGQSEDIEDAETESFDYDQIAINSVSNNWKKTFEYIQSCLIDYVGGFLRVRHQNGVNIIDYLDDDYGETSAQEIEFGKNLLDIIEENSPEDMITVLIPIGDENLTIASINNGSDELINAEAVSKYGRIVETHVFDSVNTPETLMENGERYLERHSKMPVTITVKAIDMHLVDPNAKPIHVGDKVRVSSLPHEMEDVLTCIKIEYDLENPANNTYTFGSPKQSLTERYRKDRKADQEEANRTKRGGSGKAAEEEAKKLLDKFYDAWIDFDKETGHVSLGALYKEFLKAKDVLVNQVGIDLDAPSGNINIYNLKTSYDELGNIVQSQSVAINLLNTDTKAQLELIAALDTREAEHAASFILRSDAMESVIEGKADKITLTSLEQDLRSQMDDLSAGLSSKVSSSEFGNFKQAVVDTYATIGDVRAGLESKVTIDELNGFKEAVSSTYATLEDMNAGLSSKVSSSEFGNFKQAVVDTYATIGDMNAGLSSKVETSTMDGYLTKTAASKTYAQIGEAEAAIEAYVVSSNGTNKSFVNILADQVSIQSELTDMKDLVAKKITADDIDTKLIQSRISEMATLFVDKALSVSGNSYMQNVSTSDLAVGGKFHLNAQDVETTKINIITDFTQASTAGWTATPVSMILLTTGIGDEISHTPEAGSTTTFN